MKKKKYPKRWKAQWYLITLYHPIGFFKRKSFFVWGTTLNVVERKFKKAHPTAKILSYAPVPDRTKCRCK